MLKFCVLLSFSSHHRRIFEWHFASNVVAYSTQCWQSGLLCYPGLWGQCLKFHVRLVNIINCNHYNISCWCPFLSMTLLKYAHSTLFLNLCVYWGPCQRTVRMTLLQKIWHWHVFERKALIICTRACSKPLAETGNWSLLKAWLRHEVFLCGRREIWSSLSNLSVWVCWSILSTKVLLLFLFTDISVHTE